MAVAAVLATAPITSPTVPWPTPTLNAHPRILFTPARLTRARALWASPPSNMTALKSTWNSSTTGIAHAFKYLMTGSGSEASAAYTAAASETYATLGANINMFGSLTAFVLDWCYAALTPTQIGTLVGNLETWCSSWEAQINNSPGWDVGDTFEQQGFPSWIFGVLAGEGESGFTSRIAKLRNSVQHVSLWMNESTGSGMWNAYPYQMSRKSFPCFAYFIAGNEESTIPSRFPAYLRTNLHARALMADNVSWQAKSSDIRALGTGATLGGQEYIQGYQATLPGDVLNDPVMRWMAVNMANGPGWVPGSPGSLSGNATWAAFIFWDPTASQQTPAAAGLPLCAEFPVPGVANFQGGWNRSTDVQAWYYPAHYRNAHDEPMAGHFDIRRGDDMLLDTGFNYAGSPSNWMNNSPTTCVGTYSMCRNTVLFTPSSASQQDRGACQVITQTGAASAFPWSGDLIWFGLHDSLAGKIIAYQDDGDSPGSECCCTGDLSDAYPDTLTTSYLRYFDYIRGADSTRGTFVIRDVFTAGATITRIRALFWARNAFTATGVSVVQGSTSAGVLLCDNKVKIVRGSSAAWIQMVSPSPNPVRLVGGGDAANGTLLGGADYTSYFDGVNTDFYNNFGASAASFRDQEMPRMQNIWRAEFETTPADASGQMVFVVTVGASGDSAPPTYTLSDVMTMAPLAFGTIPPPAPAASVYQGLSFDPSLGRVMFTLAGADMNSTSDQQMTSIGNTGAYAINAIYVTNASVSLSTAAGGFYTAPSKGGIPLVASSQVYSSLTSSGKMLGVSLASGATTNALTGAPYLSLTTPQGSTATADIYLVGSDLTVGTSASAANPNAAQWIFSSIPDVSSLETGRLGYINGWGGNEVGYSYTYALSNNDAALSIDVDTGIVSLSAPLSVGAHNFNVIVTNRGNPSNVAIFSTTVSVLQGVTSGRTGAQILSKSYSADDGTYGTPTGNDYTTVFSNIQAAILSDQLSAGDGKLRATILLRRGNTYQMNGTLANSWLTGIQFWILRDDPAFPSGPAPILQNVSNNANEYADGPFAIGAGSAFDHGTIKTSCATIASAIIGATTVTMLSGQSNIKVGRWHVICGNTQQIGGFPPNCTYLQYVKVLAVNGNVVTIDSPLRYNFSQTWYEDPTDDQSLGVARLVPWDCGGTGGQSPSDPRMTMRGTMLNIECRDNPNFVSGDILPGICYNESCLDISFENCTIPLATPTMTQHVYYKNCQIFSSEFDKFMETLILDGCNTLFPHYDPIGNNHVAGLHAATGCQFMMMRDSTLGCCQLSPRQLLNLGSSYDSRGDTFLQVPFSVAQFGPIFSYRFQPHNGTPTQFWSGGQDGGVWTFSGVGHVNDDPAAIGTDIFWNHAGSGANVLFIPVAYAKFNLWMTAIVAGSIIYTSTTTAFPITANWGYVSQVSSPGDGTGIYATVTWVNGSQPSSGNLYPDFLGARFIEVAPSTVFHSPCVWSDPGFIAETTAPFGPTYGFPAGLPPPYNE